MKKKLPSEEELLAGRLREDGSRPPLHSGVLYNKHTEDAFGRKLPDELREKTPVEKTALELKIAIEERRLRNYNRVEAAGNYLMDLGYSVLEDDDGRESAPSADNNKVLPSTRDADQSESSGASAPEDTPAHTDSPATEKTPTTQQTNDSCMHDLLPLPGLRDGAKLIRGGRAKKPDSPTGSPDYDQKLEQQADAAEKIVSDIQSGNFRKPSGESVRKLSAKDAPRLIYTGARLLASVTDKRAECAHNLVELTQQQDLKEAFIWDRAHAVVAATLLHLDDEFESLGFGSWMPFRYPDQWLMFCGVLRRVLAANGLIHSEHAETYRKLLEETPTPLPEIKDIQERIKWWQIPEHWSTLPRFRGARNMFDLEQRLKTEVWENPNPRPPPF